VTRLDATLRVAHRLLRNATMGRRAWPCAIVVLSVARAAAAQEAVVPVPTETVVWPDRVRTASAFAAVDAGTRTGAGVAAGGDAQLGSGSCGVLATGGAAALRAGRAPLSAVHWTRACIETVRMIDDALDITFFPVGFDHTLEWNAMPRLSARRLLWNRPFTRERIEGRIAMIGVGPQLMWGWSMWPAAFHMAGEWWHQARDDGAVMRATRREFSVAMIELREGGPGDGELVIFRFGNSDELERLDLVRMDRVPFKLGSRFRYDAWLGSADVIRPDDGDVRYTGGFTYRLGLWVDVGRFRGNVATEQDYHLTIDDAVLEDQRTEARVEYADGRRGVAVTAFVARTTLMWTDGSGEVPYQPTYGVDVDARWPLTDRIDAQLAVSSARTFYAGDGAMAPVPQTGVEISGHVLVRLGTEPAARPRIDPRLPSRR
jgi:hypothetical protein